jgi:hypothetical protein
VIDTRPEHDLCAWWTRCKRVRNDALSVRGAASSLAATRYLGRLERIVLRERDVQEEDATLVRRSGRAHDGRHPLVNVVTLGTGGAVAWRVEAYLSQLLLYSAAEKKVVSAQLSAWLVLCALLKSKSVLNRFKWCWCW